MKKLLGTLLLCAAALSAGPLSGKRVASFTLPDNLGAYHDVLDYRGKPLVIEFMRTDCPHCTEFVPVLQKVKAKYGNRISILSVVTPPDNMNTVNAYIQKNKLTWPVLFDVSQATAAMLKITPKNPTISLPTVLIVDADGIVREDVVHSGARQDFFHSNAIMGVIDRLLAPKTPAPAGKK